MSVDLVELERRFWEGAGDAEFWRGHFADDGVIVLPTGHMDKATVVGIQANSDPWETYALEDVRLVDLGEGCQAVTYRARACRAGDESDYVAAISSVYARRGGEWLLILHQQTPIGV
ncbi:MAG: nuclear transport factor 2 family protein [Acidimicrobiia bacterium]